jgi:hypothetical protein
LTADSRCKKVSKAGTTFDDTFQKIFPDQDSTVAFSQHGQNDIGGRDIQSLINDFKTALPSVFQQSIADIAVTFRDWLDKRARETLAHFHNDAVIGFWITGFSPGKSKPEFYEICWLKKIGPTSHRGLIIGGSGQKHIKQYMHLPLGQFQPGRIAKYTATFSCIYHNQLCILAEKAQRKLNEDEFEGPYQQLVIERSGWRWIKAPPPHIAK